MIAYLRLAANPHESVSLRRVINVPHARASGRPRLRRLEQFAIAEQITLYEALRRVDEAPDIPTRAQSRDGRSSRRSSTTSTRCATTCSVRRLTEEALEVSGYVAALRGGALDGGADAAGERPGAALGHRAVRVQHARARASARVPGAGGADIRHRHLRRVRQRGHADDPALRQGPGVPGGLHGRDGGGDLPAPAIAGGPRGARGGAPAVLRRA